jgi:O-glycosyl hydrolase
MRGTYLPHWGFDDRTTTDYTGQRGDHYYTTETYTTQENGQTVTRTRQVQHTRWSHAQGRVSRDFVDVLAGGVATLDSDLLHCNAVNYNADLDQIAISAHNFNEIWIIDHNYNLWRRAIAELETPGVRKYTNAVAWHGYTGKPEWMMRVQQAFPDIEMYWTEGSPDHNDPDYQKCWVSWAQKFASIFENGCRAITGWSFATDEHGKPNIGPYPCGGLITIDSRTRAIYHSGQFWAMGHFSMFIKRGAIRIESRTSAKDLYPSAFQNPDGSVVIVVTNPGTPRTCELQLTIGIK